MMLFNLYLFIYSLFLNDSVNAALFFSAGVFNGLKQPIQTELDNVVEPCSFQTKSLNLVGECC